LNFQNLHDALKGEQRVGLPAGFVAIEKILAHGQMREQRQILRDVADAALTGRHEHAQDASVSTRSPSWMKADLAQRSPAHRSSNEVLPEPDGRRWR